MAERAERKQTMAPNRDGARAMAVYESEVESAGDARSWIDEFLAAQGIGEEARDDAQLVVSELVTNALMHGAGASVVRATIDHSSVHLAVTDSGDRLPEVLPLDPDRIGGLGLIIVDRIATDWGTSAFPGGKTVWATLALRR